MLYHMLLPYVSFPLLGIILNGMYYSLILGGMVLGSVLIHNTLKEIGYPLDNSRKFVITGVIIAFPSGILSARMATMFYYQTELWGLDFFMDQFLNGGRNTFHASLFLPVLLLSTLMGFMKIRFWHGWDVISLHIPLAHAVGRLGCFFVGCCWGNPLAVHYFNVSMPNPVPLYAAALNFSLYLLLKQRLNRIYFSRHASFRKRGSIAASYLVLYGTIRFIVEIFRTESIVFKGLTQAQIVMIGYIITGVFIIISRKKPNHHFDSLD